MIATKDTNTNRGFVEKKGSPAFIAPYWLVGDANDASGVNMAQKTIEVPIKLDGDDFQIAVPVLYNPKSVKAGTKPRKSVPQSSTASGSSNVRKRKAVTQKDVSQYKSVDTRICAMSCAQGLLCCISLNTCTYTDYESRIGAPRREHPQ